MSPQQKIAERIYDLLPHKKELEFGCEIKVINGKLVTSPDEEKDIPLEELNWDSEEEELIIVDQFVKHLYKKDAKVGDTIHEVRITPDWYVILEIIGQPIRLADILLAIEIHHKSCDFITISSSGFVVHHQKDICSYNLEKDNILEQSDEFCEFLLEILK